VTASSPSPYGLFDDILVIGDLSWDEVNIHSNLPFLGDFKDSATFEFEKLGGGAGNVAQVLNQMIRHFNGNVGVTLATKLGKAETAFTPPERDFNTIRDMIAYSIQTTSDFPQLRRALANAIVTTFGKNNKNEAIRDKAQETLEQCEHITEIMDLLPDERNVVPKNKVISFRGGRFISKQPLSQVFKAATKKQSGLERYQTEQLEALKEKIKKTKIVVLQSNDSALAKFTVDIASEHNIPVVMDYSVSDRKLAEQFDDILPKCDVILAPGEAKLSGKDPCITRTWLSRIFHEDTAAKMNSGLDFITRRDAAQVLFAELIKRLKNAVISVSDGKKPVLVSACGEDDTIEITPAKKCVDQLGTGDTRTAAFVYFMLKAMQEKHYAPLEKEDYVKCLKKASVVATLSVEHPGFEWFEHIGTLQETFDAIDGIAKNTTQNATLDVYEHAL